MSHLRELRPLPTDSDQAGQGLAEYALILALIAIVAVAALMFLGLIHGERLLDQSAPRWTASSRYSPSLAAAVPAASLVPRRVRHSRPGVRHTRPSSHVSRPALDLRTTASMMASSRTTPRTRDGSAVRFARRRGRPR